MLNTLGDKEGFTQASVRLKQREARLRQFSQTTGRTLKSDRVQTFGFDRSVSARAGNSAQKHHASWLKSIGAEEAKLNTLAKYYNEKHNNSETYIMLKGYNKAVAKGDISPLVGIKIYEDTWNNIYKNLVGVTTFTGVKLDSFTTHFVDRVIGQVSTPHAGKRTSVSIDDVLDTIVNPKLVKEIRDLSSGDTRQTFIGGNASVTISIRDKRLIQTNPK